MKLASCKSALKPPGGLGGGPGVNLLFVAVRGDLLYVSFCSCVFQSF